MLPCSNTIGESPISSLTNPLTRITPSCQRGSQKSTGLPAHADLVLAADCVYFEPAFPLLVDTLVDLVAHDNPEILFCYKKRRKVLPALLFLLCSMTRPAACIDVLAAPLHHLMHLFFYSLLSENQEYPNVPRSCANRRVDHRSLRRIPIPVSSHCHNTSVAGFRLFLPLVTRTSCCLGISASLHPRSLI